MSETNYYIKSGYLANIHHEVEEKQPLEEFWNASRIKSSNYYQYPVYQYANRLIKEKGISSVADFGCGVANKLLFINRANPEIDLIGLDQEFAINYCRKTYDFGRWYVADLDNEKDQNDVHAELVICADVIEHMSDPDILLENLKKVVDSGGWILLSTPERDRLRGKNCMNCPHASHVREWNFKELELYLDSRGFKVAEHFLQYPIKFGFNEIVYHEIVKRALHLKPLKYNQVCLLRVG